jgi:RNA polymerase sigma factor (sigma-70 family)
MTSPEWGGGYGMHMREREREVVAYIVADGPEWLAQAYDGYSDPLYKYCRSMLGNPADAADAVQDTFVIAAARLDGPREPERLRAWLYAVARNECLRVPRAAKPAPELDGAPDVTGEVADVGEDAERAKLRALLRDAADGLNPAEREVIELQLRQGLEPAEVAAVLGMSVGHANSLLTRARNQLEACLGVLLAGRAGREECGRLASMLTGWDGRLTVPLRKRVGRHIERCPTCFTRRAFELRPAMLLGLSPGAAMAAAAAESCRLAAGAPAGLKAHTLTLAFGQGPAATAHRAAVLGRAGSFGKHGFPRSARHAGATAGLLRFATKGGLRSSPERKATVAVGVLLVVAIAAAAVALTRNTEHITLAGAKPPGSAPPLAAGAAAPATSPAKSTAATSAPHGGASASKPASPAPTSATSNPATAPTPASSTPAPPPPPAPATLVVTPSGGTLMISQGGGASITLTAQGGPVNWSIAVSGNRSQHVHVDPSSGTLAAGASVPVTVTVDHAATGGSLTVSPGGTVFTIVIS